MAKVTTSKHAVSSRTAEVKTTPAAPASKRAGGETPRAAAPARAPARSAPASAKARPIGEVRQAHTEALTRLGDLKRAEPRDADAVLKQKHVVQGFAADLAAREPSKTE